MQQTMTTRDLVMEIKTIMVNFWLSINGVIYLILGFMFIFQLETIAANLNLLPQTGSASIELVTVYGGLEAGLGILFIVALFVSKYRRFAIQLLTFTYACFVAGRLAGLIGHQVTDNLTYYLLLFEVVGFALSALLLLKSADHSTARD